MWGYFDMEQNKLVWMAATAVGAMQLARCSQRCSWSTTFRGGGCIEQRWPTVQKVILISVPGVTLIISEKLSRCSQIRQLFRVVHCFRRDQVEQLFRGFISIDFGCGPIKRTGNSKPAFKCFFYFLYAGLKSNYKVSSEQELFAYGLANTVSSFFSSYPIAASFGR